MTQEKLFGQMVAKVRTDVVDKNRTFSKNVRSIRLLNRRDRVDETNKIMSIKEYFFKEGAPHGLSAVDSTN
jgi:hypothetical protein